jgi:hypothetical protein
MPRGERGEHADPPYPVGLLRARRKRPSSRAAEQRDELASPHGPLLSSGRHITTWLRENAVVHHSKIDRRMVAT